MSRDRFVAAVFTIVLALALPSCSGKPSGEREPETISFATWDDFLDQRGATADKNRVVFIGLDGATWPLIDPLISRGLLPNFAKLKQEGSWGTLRSTECYISPPAWTTMLSGFLSERTGIYSFGHWSPQERRFLPLRSTDVLVPTVWDIASLGGANTAVINVPVTFPVQELNGIMVSGLLTPMRHAVRNAFQVKFARFPDGDELPDNAPASYSPYLRGTLDYLGNTFDFYLCDTRDDNIRKHDYVVVSVRSPGTPARSSGADMATYTDWIQVDVVQDDQRDKGWCRIAALPTQVSDTYIARFSQVLWSSTDTDVQYTFPEAVAGDINKVFPHYFPSTYLDRELVLDHTDDAAAYAKFFFEYDDWDLYFFVFTQTDNILHADGMTAIAEQVFVRIDRFLGELVAELGDDHTLILGSDHGFAEYDYSIDMNRIFERVDLVTYENDRDVDFDRSLAFHNMWGVYFNDAMLSREELQRRGIECPSGVEPREALIDYIKALGKGYLPRQFQRDVELEFTAVDAGAAGLPPDMIVKGTYPQHQIEFWNLNKPQPEVITELSGSARWFHTRDGIYLMRGPGIRAGVNAPMTDIQNVTPTILYLLGLPAPTNSDGGLISGIFEPEAMARWPRFVVEDYAALPREIELPTARRESLEKQLRSLGYIR